MMGGGTMAYQANPPPLSASIPYRHQFVSWLLCFCFSSLLFAWITKALDPEKVSRLVFITIIENNYIDSKAFLVSPPTGCEKRGKGNPFGPRQIATQALMPPQPGLEVTHPCLALHSAWLWSHCMRSPGWLRHLIPSTDLFGRVINIPLLSEYSLVYVFNVSNIKYTYHFKNHLLDVQPSVK